MGDVAVGLPPVDPETRFVTLVVAWRSGRRAAAARVSIAGDALEALRDACRTEAERISAFQAPIEFEPGDDVTLEADEYGWRSVEGVADPLGIRALLGKPAALDLLAPAEIAKRTLLFYAVVTGDEDARTAWITKANPARVLRRGFFLWDQAGSLARVQAPLFLFEERVDLVLTPERLWMVSVPAYEALFEETHITAAEASARVATGISAHLPIYGDGAEVLARAAVRRVAYARLLEKIRVGDRLKDVTVRRVREYARRQGVDPTTVVKGDALFVNEDDPGVLLRLLNEDLFRGGLTDTAWEAAAKRARDPD